MVSILRPALVLLVLFTLVTGLGYPGLVTGFARLAFPSESNGSLLREGGRVVGSRLIGQPFTAPAYFWGRPSATTSTPYDGASSAGSNLGPTNPSLHSIVAERRAALVAADGGAAPRPVPIDLVVASGSGLDPHISPAAALFQVSRVARHRGLPEAKVRRIVEAHIEGRTLGFLGEPRVNVLLLNRSLDAIDGRGA